MGTLTLAAQRKRDQILAGALQSFLQAGYEGTSMDRVATAAGGSKITIYKHFQDKEGLFTALIEQVTARRFHQIFDDRAFEGEPDQVLRHIAHRVLDMLAIDAEYIAFLRLIVGESGRFPALAQLFVQALPQKVWAVLSQYFARHPDLHSPCPEATARIFMGALISYVMTQKILHGQAIAPLNPDTLVECLVTMVLGQPPLQTTADP
ncbi:MAG: TetR/AcrR family transcriptional regulator [Cyanobacteria bacterium]|nr:TetR/AcrR family transcriptional regulator [Cyanobacteriota bacterium]